MNTPILETERLILRPFKETDLMDVYYGWETDEDVARYMFWTSHHDINRTKDFIRRELRKISSDLWYRWAIVNKATNELIGTCLIYYDEYSKSNEVGYNLAKKFWGKGYTTEAMKRALVFAKEDLKWASIYGEHAKVNIASENVLKKLGFKYICDVPYDCGGKLHTEGKRWRLEL